jgi:hypothetical protein
MHDSVNRWLAIPNEDGAAQLVISGPDDHHLHINRNSARRQIERHIDAPQVYRSHTHALYANAGWRHRCRIRRGYRLRQGFLPSRVPHAY